VLDKSFLNELDFYTIGQIREALAYRLFDDWVNNFDGDNFELDYAMASNVRDQRIRATFNEFYQLKPTDEYYLPEGDSNGTNL
jgi:hypothetical protein